MALLHGNKHEPREGEVKRSHGIYRDFRASCNFMVRQLCILVRHVVMVSHNRMVTGRTRCQGTWQPTRTISMQILLGVYAYSDPTRPPALSK